MPNDPLTWRKIRSRGFTWQAHLLLHVALEIHVVVHGAALAALDSLADWAALDSLVVNGLSAESLVEAILHGILGLQGPARRLVALEEILGRLAL